jgi:hypothetical protein
MDLLLDPTRALIPPSCLQIVQVHTVLMPAGVGLVRTRRNRNRNHVLTSTPLSAHVRFAMTDRLVALPAHLLTVAPVLMEPPNGRGLRYTEMPEEMNERLQNGRVRQAPKM